MQFELQGGGLGKAELEVEEVEEIELEGVELEEAELEAGALVVLKGPVVVAAA